MAAGSNSKMGENIVVVDLVIQILFGLFAAASVVFHLLYRQHNVVYKAFGSTADLDEQDHSRFEPAFEWEDMIFMLYGTSALILVRSISRIVEYGMGSDGYLLSYERSIFLTVF